VSSYASSEVFELRLALAVELGDGADRGAVAPDVMACRR
jgi:hypothetical protein